MHRSNYYDGPPERNLCAVGVGSGSTSWTLSLANNSNVTRTSWTHPVCPVRTPQKDLCVRLGRWDHPVMANRNEQRTTNNEQRTTNNEQRNEHEHEHEYYETNKRLTTRGIDEKEKNKKEEKNERHGRKSSAASGVVSTRGWDSKEQKHEHRNTPYSTERSHN